MSSGLRRSIPLFLFISLCYFLYRGIYQDPHHLPSTLLNKTAPSLALPMLESPDRLFDSRSLLGQVTLLNVWASWCEACRLEVPSLRKLKRETSVTLLGLAYKDEAQQLRDWLTRFGNPYQHVLLDEVGETAIDWGVYGTPESFLIDKKGRIRYKHVGLLTERDVTETLGPLIAKLDDED